MGILRHIFIASKGEPVLGGRLVLFSLLFLKLKPACKYGELCMQYEFLERGKMDAMFFMMVWCP